MLPLFTHLGEAGSNYRVQINYEFTIFGLQVGTEGVYNCVKPFYSYMYLVYFISLRQCLTYLRLAPNSKVATATLKLILLSPPPKS